jgi:hypothetical protein
MGIGAIRIVTKRIVVVGSKVVLEDFDLLENNSPFFID